MAESSPLDLSQAFENRRVWYLSVAFNRSRERGSQLGGLLEHMERTTVGGRKTNR